MNLKSMRSRRWFRWSERVVFGAGIAYWALVLITSLDTLPMSKVSFWWILVMGGLLVEEARCQFWHRTRDKSKDRGQSAPPPAYARPDGGWRPAEYLIEIQSFSENHTVYFPIAVDSPYFSTVKKLYTAIDDEVEADRRDALGQNSEPPSFTKRDRADEP